RATADIRREIEERSRELAAKQNRLHTIYTSTRGEDGKRTVHAHQAEEIARLERECASLTPAINALKFDYGEANNRETLERLEADPLRGVNLFDGRGGQGLSAAEAAQTMAAKARLPESVGHALIAAKSFQGWRHGSQNQSAFADIDALNFRDYYREY